MRVLPSSPVTASRPSKTHRLVLGLALTLATIASACCGGMPLDPSEGTGGSGSGGGGGLDACGTTTLTPSGTLGVYRSVPDIVLPGMGGAAGSGSDGFGGAKPDGPSDETEVFTPLAPGDDVWLQWGSQVGMGLGVTLQLAGVASSTVGRVEVTLLVDGFPLGSQVHEPPPLSCRTDQPSLDAMVMVDVGPHPTVTSVAQLDEREAVVQFEVSNLAGAQIVAGELPVILNL